METKAKSLFESEDYKVYVRAWIQSQPKNGRGQLLKFARLLGISSVSVSHVFSGPRHLTPEQAVELAEFLGLNPIEDEYFQLLVAEARAGTPKLREKTRRQRDQVRERARQVKSRLALDGQITEAVQATFYSEWYFSAVRMLTAIEGFHSVTAIADRLHLPKPLVRETLEFLARHGLCVEKGGAYHIGPKKTHLGADAALASRHHVNWRLKGIENVHGFGPDEMFYTAPMHLSAAALKLVRAELVEAVARAIKIVSAAESEELACLNIDFFRVR